MVKYIPKTDKFSGLLSSWIRNPHVRLCTLRLLTSWAPTRKIICFGYAIPLIIFIVLSCFLWLGLELNPREELPSQLIDKPVPKVTYQFTKQQQQDFIRLTKQLRCMVCQNQALYDSMAPFAMDLKQQIYNMLIVDKTEQEITDFLVIRYGDFINYDPKFRPNTWLLWFAPLIFFSIGLLVLLKTVKKT